MFGASKNRKVFDPASNAGKHGVLEIECPFSKRPDSLEQAADDPSFYLLKTGSSYYLKRDYPVGYYAQGQLAITGLKWCNFCVFFV